MYQPLSVLGSSEEPCGLGARSSGSVLQLPGNVAEPYIAKREDDPVSCKVPRRPGLYQIP